MFVESYYYGNLYVVMFVFQFAEAVNTEPCMAMRTQHVAKYRRYVRKQTRTYANVFVQDNVQISRFTVSSGKVGVSQDW